MDDMQMLRPVETWVTAPQELDAQDDLLRQSLGILVAVAALILLAVSPALVILTWRLL